MSFADRARSLAAQARQEQERQRLSTAEAERQRAADQYRHKLSEIEDFAKRLPEIVTTEASGGKRNALIRGGITASERELWRPVENRCKELGIHYHMKKNHIPSCIRIRIFYCLEHCGNTYHLEVSW